MSDDLAKRDAYFEGGTPAPFDAANLTPIIKAMDAMVSETVARMYHESYPRIEDLEPLTD